MIVSILGCEDKFLCVRTNENNDATQDVQTFILEKEKNVNKKMVLLYPRKSFTSEKNLIKILNDIKLYLSLGIQREDIVIAMENDGNYFTTEDWASVKHIGKRIADQGISFGSYDMDKIWSLEETENANASIVKIANNVKQKQSSPLEQLLAAFIKVTTFEYKEETIDEHFSTSRSIYGVLNGSKIVCVGYAEILHAVMDCIGNKDIKVYNNSVMVEDFGHANLIVKIKDEKYGIDGFYYIDPCWSEAYHNEEMDDSHGRFINLNYFLIPLDDIKRMKSKVYSTAGKVFCCETIDRGCSFASDDILFNKQFILDNIKDLSKNEIDNFKKEIILQNKNPSTYEEYKYLSKIRYLCEKENNQFIPHDAFNQFQLSIIDEKEDSPEYLVQKFSGLAKNYPKNYNELIKNLSLACKNINFEDFDERLIYSLQNDILQEDEGSFYSPKFLLELTNLADKGDVSRFEKLLEDSNQYLYCKYSEAYKYKLENLEGDMQYYFDEEKNYDINELINNLDYSKIISNHILSNYVNDNSKSITYDNLSSCLKNVLHNEYLKKMLKEGMQEEKIKSMVDLYARYILENAYGYVAGHFDEDSSNAFSQEYRRIQSLSYLSRQEKD